MTINEALNLLKEVNSRVRSLEQLRDKVSVQERYYSATEKENTPLYNVQEVDKLIVELNKLGFLLNNAIKNANATTDIGVDIQYDVVFKQLT